MSVFQKLYDFEINFSVSCFWDGGFKIKIGDEMNGFKAEGSVRMWAEVEPWLAEQAAVHFAEVLAEVPSA